MKAGLWWFLAVVLAVSTLPVSSVGSAEHDASRSCAFRNESEAVPAGGKWMTSTSGSVCRRDRIIVQPKTWASPEQIRQLHQRIGARVLHRVGPKSEWEILEIPLGSSSDEIAGHYQAHPWIERVELDFMLHTLSVPDDPHYQDGSQWHLSGAGSSGSTGGIGAAEGWSVRSTAEDVVVAIIDTGVRLTHEDLAANLWVNPGESGLDELGREKQTNGIDDDANGFVDDVHGIDAMVNSGNPADLNGHGTHVAGLLGAVGNNGVGVAGVAWRTQIMTLKFMDQVGKGSVSDAIQCIDYARRHGAAIVNASWGSTSYSAFLESAIRRARDDGIIFVAAAGNEATDNDRTPFYPSGFDLDNIVSVGSTTSRDRLWNLSNYGLVSVDLAAPGIQLFSTFHTSDSAYGAQSGSSVSAPLVAGACALILQQFPSLDYRDAIQHMFRTVDLLPALSGKCSTGGRLNLATALGTDPEDAGAIGILRVDPSDDWLVEGPEGSPTFGSTQYTLKNIGGAPLIWTASSPAHWLQLLETGGTLNPGESALVTVSIRPEGETLLAGAHRGTVLFENQTSAQGTTTRAVQLTVLSAGGGLVVGPEAPFAAAGPEGGPFYPPLQEVWLTNRSSAQLAWSVTLDQPWLTLSSSGGILGAGESGALAIFLNAMAAGLPSGRHETVLTFSDLSAPGTEEQRLFILQVGGSVRLVAPAAALSGDGFRFEMEGQPGEEYLIERSLDLETWNEWQSATANEEGRASITDGDSTSRSRQFYRVRRVTNGP